MDILRKRIEPDGRSKPKNDQIEVLKEDIVKLPITGKHVTKAVMIVDVVRGAKVIARGEMMRT